ncbi:MAG: hypothetical protein HY543_06090, partial [Deltaproteobacteria bacterium]|nr:hypothetical protein [Deltaproteobacteria bacterium]
ARPPQQSDYAALWSARDNASIRGDGESRLGSVEKRPLAIRLAKSIIPSSVRRVMRKTFERPAQKPVGFDPQFFVPMDPKSVGRN